MELERLAIDDDGMTCIVASRTAGNDVEFAAESVDNFALAFVAPLSSYNDYIFCHISLRPIAFSLAIFY